LAWLSIELIELLAEPSVAESSDLPLTLETIVLNTDTSAVSGATSSMGTLFCWASWSASLVSW
jgi:hypothetical protein